LPQKRSGIIDAFEVVEAKQPAGMDSSATTETRRRCGSPALWGGSWMSRHSTIRTLAEEAVWAYYARIKADL
jgi:hypothetical protein